MRRIVERLRDRVKMRGFLTEEVLAGGKRLGFRGVTLDGKSFPLAERDMPSKLQIGPYGVTLDGLDSVGVEALEPREDTQLIVLDEVGKIELLSERFREHVQSLLDGKTPVLGTVARHGVGFVRRLRRDPRITLVTMRRHDGDTTVGELVRRLRDIGIR
jgi:nucleoside-triphosphatase